MFLCYVGGMTSRQTAYSLGMKETSVKSHRKDIARKLGTHDAIEASRKKPDHA